MKLNKESNKFDHKMVRLDVLKKRAFNYRWAAVEDGVIPLTAADPDFPVANEIIEAINDYLKPGILSYGPSTGLLEFREAISGWYASTKNIYFKPDHILPVNSAAFGLFLAALTLLKKGDKAIILEPVDFLFRKAIENAGAEVVVSTLNTITGEINEEDFKAKIDKSVKAIFICNPNNPLGKAMTSADLIKIANIAHENDLWVVSDEIWADINYDASFQSIAACCHWIKDKTITISGLSKNFGLAGLRIGYICVENTHLFQKLFQASKFDTTAYGISTLSQIAGTAALSKANNWLSDFLVHLAEMKQYVEKRLSKISILESNNPNSTYLFFPKIKSNNYTSQEMCDYILKNAKVALVPGGKNWFEQSSEGYIRICYATSKPILEEAFDRIEFALNKGNLY